MPHRADVAGRDPEVAPFLLAAFGISWSCWVVALVSAPSRPLLLVAGSFGPTVAAVAIIARRQGRAGLARALRRLVTVRGTARTVLAAAAVPVAIVAAACVAEWVLGGTVEPSWPAWWAMPIVLGYVLVLGGPLGEELGWRGVLLPRLEADTSPAVASLLVGLAWAVWHLPLFFVAGTIQQSVPWWLFAAQIVVTSFVYTWLVHRAPRSLVPALVFHTVFNVSVGIAFLGDPDEPATRAMVIAMVIAALVVVGLVRTRAFQDRASVSTPVASTGRTS